MPDKRKNILSGIGGIFRYQQFGLIIGLIVLLIVMVFKTPSFFQFDTVLSMLQNNSVYAVMAVGVMFVILTGGIDLSVASTLALSGVTVTLIMKSVPQIPVFVLILISMAVGALCGAFNGVLIGKFKMVPLIATLGTMYIFRGLAFLISGGSWIMPHDFTEGYKAVTQTKILGIPSLIWIVVLIFILTGLFLGYTKAGRRIYAIGTNPESAKVSGINEGNVKIMAYTLCGMLAGFSGMLYTSNYVICSSQIADGFEMTAIAICILGGVSIVGGRGRIDGVAIGVILMAVISSFISLLPGLSIWQDAIKGAIIIAAVILNIATSRFSEKRALRERSALI